MNRAVARRPQDGPSADLLRRRDHAGQPGVPVAPGHGSGQDAQYRGRDAATPVRRWFPPPGTPAPPGALGHRAAWSWVSGPRDPKPKPVREGPAAGSVSRWPCPALDAGERGAQEGFASYEVADEIRNPRPFAGAGAPS